MPFGQQEPPSRWERAQGAFRGCASSAAQNFPGASNSAQNAAIAAQVAAQQAANQASVAAQQAAARAAVTATQMAERARPMANEAANRGTAAWRILLYGAPPPPVTTRVVTVARRGRLPLGLMMIGAIASVGMLWWRRSQMADTVWVLDEDSDVEPAGRWHEGDSHAADDTAVDAGGGQATTGHHSQSQANRWP